MATAVHMWLIKPSLIAYLPAFRQARGLPTPSMRFGDVSGSGVGSTAPIVASGSREVLNKSGQAWSSSIFYLMVQA